MADFMDGRDLSQNPYDDQLLRGAWSDGWFEMANQDHGDGLEFDEASNMPSGSDYLGD